jgi:hypothetical protein
MDLQSIKEIRTELKRFNKRLIEAEKRLQSDYMAKYGCRETGALKRAALDLKMELTRLI